MFKAFSERIDPATRKRMALSVIASAVVYSALLGTVVVAASGVTDKPEVVEEKGTDVTFVKELPKKAEPPAPAPAAAPPAPKPVEPPPKEAKVEPPKPKPKPAPTKMNDKELPTKAPPENPIPADTAPPAESQNFGTGDADAKGTGAGGNGDGDATGTGTGTGTGDATGGGGGAVVLPAGATPPERIGMLVTAEDYPRAMLAARVEGEVIVKVIIQVDGTVTLVKFIKSDQNFDEAVKKILQRVRFKPAIYNGSAIAVYQNLRFPFTIDDE